MTSSLLFLYYTKIIQMQDMIRIPTTFLFLSRFAVQSPLFMSNKIIGFFCICLNKFHQSYDSRLQLNQFNQNSQRYSHLMQLKNYYLLKLILKFAMLRSFQTFKIYELSDEVIHVPQFSNQLQQNFLINFVCFISQKVSFQTFDEPKSVIFGQLVYSHHEYYF